MKRESLLLLACSLISGSLARPSSVILAYQDSLGQYSFGYSAPGSARSEIRTVDGNTHGAYSYIDAAGNIQTAQYSADSENGFRVLASNLPLAPLPVQDTPEVMAAREAHLQALQMAEDRDVKLKGENQEKASSEGSSRSSNVESQSEEKSKGDNVKQQSAEKNLKKESPEKLTDITQEKSAEILATAESNKSDASKKSNTVDSPDVSKKDDQVAIARDIKANIVPVYTVQVLPQDSTQDTTYTLPLHGISQVTRKASSSDIDQTSSSQTLSESLTPAGTTLNVEPLAGSKNAPSTTAPEKHEELQKRQEQPELIALPTISEHPLYYINYVFI